MGTLVAVALSCVAILSVWSLIYMLRKWRREDEEQRLKDLTPEKSFAVRTSLPPVPLSKPDQRFDGDATQELTIEEQLELFNG